jgi:hypothetical protein
VRNSIARLRNSQARIEKSGSRLRNWDVACANAFQHALVIAPPPAPPKRSPQRQRAPRRRPGRPLEACHRQPKGLRFPKDLTGSAASPRTSAAMHFSRFFEKCRSLPMPFEKTVARCRPRGRNPSVWILYGDNLQSRRVADHDLHT